MNKEEGIRNAKKILELINKVIDIANEVAWNYKTGDREKDIYMSGAMEICKSAMFAQIESVEDAITEINGKGEKEG